MSGETRDNAGVIAPPPLLLLVALVVGFGAGYLWPAPFAPDAARYPVAAALGAAGVALLAMAILRFRRVGTPVEPWRSTTVLVLDGPYRVSRNPIYVAGALIYIAIAIAVDEAWLLVTLVPALLALRYGVIAREERYLEAKFGDEYRRYKASVRRWL